MSDITDALNPVSKSVTIGGKKFTVIELEFAADAAAFADQADGMLHMLVACVRDENGAEIFAPADFPSMRKMSKKKIQLLVKEVMEVNGMLAEETEKKSDAQQ